MFRERLDLLLVEKGFFSSREKAQAEIMVGNILVDKVKVEKAGTIVEDNSKISIIKQSFPYVSRGALKLIKALDEFSFEIKNKLCLDIGASTGGFTEVLLLNGAKKVYSIDVGHNQLAYKLRKDKRVTSKEKINARYLTLDILDNNYMDVIVTDVSFISLDKILKPAYGVLNDNGWMVALIKPQFEAGKDKSNKKGIVSDKKIHKEVINKVISFAFDEVGFSALDLAKSSITGKKGNIEYLLLLKKKKVRKNTIDKEKINRIVFS